MYNPYYFYHNNQNQIVTNHLCQPVNSSNTMTYNDDFIYQSVMTTMNSHQQILKQIKDIKDQLLQVKSQNIRYKEIIQKLQRQKKDNDQMEKKDKKIFKKNIICPYQTCNNKYSSKIALNSHIRAKHKKSKNNSQSSIPQSLSARN